MTRPDAPEVTVIVAVYNAAKTIGQCLNSVIGQTSNEVEIVVIDGGSTDGTQKVVASFSKQISYFVSETDSGVYEAFNKGVSAANGKWLMFLGADDFLYRPESLESLLTNMRPLQSEEKIVYGQILVEDKEGNKNLFGSPWGESKHNFKNVMSIPHVGMLHHQSLFKEHGFFDQSFKVAGDYEFVFRELSSKDALFVPGVIVAEHRYGGLSTDPKFGLIAHMELWRARRKNGKIFPGKYWLAKLPRVLFLPSLVVLFGQERGKSLHQNLKRIIRNL